MNTQYDAVIIGAGHNGLTCACYLAKAGMKVCMVERAPFVGGAAISREVFPGHKVSVASYWMSLLQPKIMRDLELKKNGVEVIPTPPTFQPFEDGRSIMFWPETERFAQELAAFSAQDAEAFKAYDAHMQRLVPLVRRLIFETPVDPSTMRPADLLKTAGLVWRMKDASKSLHDMWELLTLSAWDFLSRWFESDEVLTLFASYASGSAGMLSPKSPGSAYVLARPYLRDNTTEQGGGGLVRGGMGAISDALLKVAEANGVKVITGQAVTRALIENGRATGVELDDGTVIKAPVVISNAGAKHTFDTLIGHANLSPEVIGAVKRHRTKSIAFKINLSTNALPQWTAYEERRLNDPAPGGITIAENSAELEGAFQSALNGEMARHPYLWITTPSAFDSTVAPEGRHVVQIMGGHVPYKLNGRDWDAAAKKELLDIVVAQICRYAPGFEAAVLDAQILTPKDIEEMFWMVDGHVHHGEMSLDQVFFRRPISHHADYRTPIKGMYMCGAANHPGGGVTGVPGHNAAREILKDQGKKFPAKSVHF